MKTTFRLPRELRAAMRNAARKAYGPKGKSRWVREALEQLFKEDPALGSVGAAEDLAQNDALDMVDLGNRLPSYIENAIMHLRRQDPLMEGVQSLIIRAAIRHRLSTL